MILLRALRIIKRENLAAILHNALLLAVESALFWPRIRHRNPGMLNQDTQHSLPISRRDSASPRHDRA